uniref:Kinectin n=1 Tax=Elaeophora elaphi TaxID=1147741 RepID=A0A0R3RVV3_9BILA
MENHSGRDGIEDLVISTFLIAALCYRNIQNCKGMDPTSFGFVAVIAVLITIISIIVFKMYPKETDFEKAYGENALRLLTEDRANKTKNAKNKNKGKSGERKKDFGAEEKQNRNEKPANGDLLYVRLPTNGHYGAEETNGTNGDEADTKLNRKKSKGKQLMAETKQHMESTKDEKIVVAKNVGDLSGQQDVSNNIIAQPEVVPTAGVLHDENKRTDIGERKSKKKNRARRNGEHLRQIAKEDDKVTEEIVPAMEILSQESEEKMLEKKVFFFSGNPLKDINTNKFQARLNAIAELEPEYITFLTNFINNTKTQRAKLNDEIALMRKQIADKDRLVLQCTNKLTAAEQKDSEIAVLQKTLTEEKRKYKLFEQTVCTQLSNNAQEKSYLQRKYDQILALFTSLLVNITLILHESKGSVISFFTFSQLQGEFGALREEMKKAQSVIHSTPPPVDIKPYQQQIDRLKAELTSSKNRCSQQELELNQRLQAMQQIRKELQNQDCQIEHLSKTNALLEKRLQDVEGNAKAERDTLEMKLQNTMKVAEELSVVTSEIRDEMLQHKGSAETAVQEREKHCEQIHILNAQLMDANRERVRYLNNCTTYCKTLAEMKTANADLSSQLEVLKNLTAVKNAACDELTKEVEKYRKQLADIMEAQNKETTKLRNELECIQKEKENYVKQLSIEISSEAAEVAKCRKELIEFKSEYNKKLNRIVSLEEEIAKYKKIEMERETMVSSCNDVSVPEKVSILRNSQLSSNIFFQELREANYKVVEISQQQEAIFKKHLEEVKKNHEKALQQYCCNVFKALRAIAPSNIKFPNLPIIYDNDQFYKWLKDVENVIQKCRNVKLLKVFLIGLWKKIYVYNLFKQFNTNEDDDNEAKVNLAKVAELEASNRRYRAALSNLSSHIDAIEQEAISKEKVYLDEISRLQHDINELQPLKKQLENEHERKLELISEAAKLCEVINGAQKHDNRRTKPHVKNKSAFDNSATNYG